MTKWYMVYGYSPEIKVLNVIKETEKTLLYQPGLSSCERLARTLKRDTYTACFRTWQEAHDFLLRKLERRLASEEEAVAHCREKLEKARQLKESQDDPHITD